MINPEVDVAQQIGQIDRQIEQLISSIKYVLAEGLTGDDEDFYTNLIAVDNDWTERINFPVSKDEAISILDDPNSSYLDKLSASLFAEMWKKHQIKKGNNLLKENKGGWLVFNLDDD